MFHRDPTLINKSLRWTTLGIEYDWNTKEYPREGRELPEELVELGSVICDALKLGEMRPDAAIVNYYPPKSSLSPHVDRSERTNAPLVSMSLGQSAVYLSGGKTLSEKPIPIWLRNGDILVMHGEQRLVYHAVPCIGAGEGETFESTNKPLEQYLNTSRVNITIRQVN
uniref:Fe2OG dioxygenase domain-containing protein n=1 Tax=Caenorhabditis japonica TaxID=281687 RepID=A0A8R1E0F7_CAEJA